MDLSLEILISRANLTEKHLVEVTKTAARLVKTMAFCLVWMMEKQMVSRLDLSSEILIWRAILMEKCLVVVTEKGLNSAEMSDLLTKMAAHLGQKMALKRLTATRWDLSWEILILTDYQKEKCLVVVSLTVYH